MRDPFRHFAAELIGMFAFVFIGSGVILLSKMPGMHIGLLAIALAHGLTMAVMVTATMRISGHINPAVTLGFLAARRIEPIMAGIYILAQLLGATIAAAALRGLFPPDVYQAAAGGGQSLALGVTVAQGYVFELIATFLLVFIVFGTAVDPRSPHVGGFAIGGIIAADILAIGPLTGASMNPARSFGPAIVSGIWTDQLVYWIGPILGGIAAGLLYDWLFLRRPVEPADHGTVAPARGSDARG